MYKAMAAALSLCFVNPAFFEPGVVRRAHLVGDATITTGEAHVVARIPFGTGHQSIRPWKAGDCGHGIPTSFCADATGAIHLLVPHEHAILVVDRRGTVTKKVQLRCGDGRSLDESVFLYDLALGSDGTYLVLERSGGFVIRFSPDGRARAGFGHFVAAHRLVTEATGFIVVSDTALSMVNRFEPAGRFVGYVKGRQLFPVAGARGQYVRAAIVDKHRGFVWLRRHDHGRPRLLTIVDPVEKGASLYELDPLGFDSQGVLTVLTTEKGSKGYVSHLYRIGPTGAVDSVVAVPASMELATELPRFHRVLPDGRVLTFRTEEDAYVLLAYDPLER